MTRTTVRQRVAVTVGFLGASLIAFAAGATVGAEWQKDEVTPVVLVKPAIGGFEPVDGSSIGNTWPKSAVRPVLLVRPAIGGFEPVEGSAIGNSWKKEAVVPVMLVEPNGLSFAPMQRLTDGPSARAREAPSGAQPAGRLRPAAGAPTLQSLIQSKIDGDFEGWDGETLFKLDGGQIWQQAAYAYHYHYAFSPAVTLVKVRGDVYRMTVEGVEQTVDVRRIK